MKILNKAIYIKNLYYLQHAPSEYKPFYYGHKGDHGMNSCGSPTSPLEEFLENEIDENEFDFESTYEFDFEIKIKIHKLTPEEEDNWAR